MDATTVAAFTAAGLSLVNVALSARLASHGHRQQWRRDQERPIVARCLTLSGDALGEWWDASVAWLDMDADAAWKGSKAQQHWRKGREALSDLRYEVAQLDLLASRSVREVANELVKAHEKEARWLVVLKPGEDDFEHRVQKRETIIDLQRVLVEAARIDLGLGRPVPPRSLLGKILATPYE